MPQQNYWQKQISKAVRQQARPVKRSSTQPPPVLKRLEIWAIDFDGTLCENRWPEIGEARQDVIDIVRKAQRNGKRLILWTCREGEHLDAAIEWCRERGITFDAVNDNLPEIKERYQCNPRKITANVYLDDRAFYARERLEVLWQMA